MIKNISNLLVLAPIVIFSIMPPVVFCIPADSTSPLWFWLVAESALAGILFFYSSANLLIKSLVGYSLVNCFLSATPNTSFTAFISVMACAYFYLICRRLENYDIVFKVIQSIFFMNCFLLVLQFFGKDSLLNFGLYHPVVFGTIGNSMQMGSFIVVLSAILALSNKLYVIPALLASILVHSAGAVLALSLGGMVYCAYRIRKNSLYGISAASFLLAIYAMSYGVVHKFFLIRGPVWFKSVKISLRHPVVGYGIGSFKEIFTSFVSCDKWNQSHYDVNRYVLEGVWKNAHNFFVQMFFEMGGIGVALWFGFLVVMVCGFFKSKKHEKAVRALCGLTAIIVVAQLHFPERMIQCVPLLIVFISLYQREVCL